MPNRPSTRNNPRSPRIRQALDSAALERLALDYAGRYASSRARLAAYLHRKIRERGWGGDEAPPVDAIVERFARLGYVDDRSVAEARGRALAARGYGPGRLDSALRGLGIAAEDAGEAREHARDEAWETALAFARRRRIGPFATGVQDEATRRRAVNAMLRAGHSIDTIRKITELDREHVPDWDM